MNLLLVGRGKENQIVSRMVRNSGESVSRVYCWPGFSGSDTECNSLPIGDDASTAEVVRAAINAQVDLVILTSECAIASGIANALQSVRIPCFGPTRVASHFRWDSDHASRLFSAIGVRSLSDSSHPQGENLIRGKLIAMVSGTRVHGVGITNGISENVSLIVVDRFVREIASVDSRYDGWIVIDVEQSDSDFYINTVQCLPPIEYLENLAVNPNFDFMRRVKTLMRNEARDFKHVVQQTLAPCLVPA